MCSMKFRDVKSALTELGVTIRYSQEYNEYTVALSEDYAKRRTSRFYFTDDLLDAMVTGTRMYKDKVRHVR